MSETMSSVQSPTEVDSTLIFARDVADGLAQDPKRVPSRYLYDSLGSQLFDAICELPWYTITRGERSLLAQHRGAILSGLGADPILIELGAGNGEKLTLLLQSPGFQPARMRVHLVDISRAALSASSRILEARAGVQVVTHETTYQLGLRAARAEMSGDGPVLVAFLGSNIGNLGAEEADQFLRDIREGCRPGDQFLLGADLIKPERDLLLAYDDPLGVTAAFNKNLLVRLNRELDADFDVDAFDHHVVWNASASRVEAYLVSRIDQDVCVRDAGCCIRLTAGESIWTECSHKYEADGIVAMGTRAGFSLRQQWIEPDARFALTLLEA